MSEQQNAEVAAQERITFLEAALQVALQQRNEANDRACEAQAKVAIAVQQLKAMQERVAKEAAPQ